MTHREIFETGVGGSDALKQVIDILAANGDYCLIGGMAINCYVEPVYTEDTDFAIAFDDKTKIKKTFKDAGIKVKDNRYDMSIFVPNSQLIIHITTDERYKNFGKDAKEHMLFDEFKVKVASLENLIQAKTWCLEDSCRKASKQFKDQADLCRIGENYPELQNLLPKEIRIVLKEKSEEAGMEF